MKYIFYFHAIEYDYDVDVDCAILAKDETEAWILFDQIYAMNAYNREFYYHSNWEINSKETVAINDDTVPSQYILGNSNNG